MIAFDFKKTLQGVDGDFVLEARGEIQNGERVSFFGSSGAGKSTILKILAGLLKPDCGEVSVDGEIWNSKDFFLPPQKRKIGFVFQDYALFPHLSIKDNLLFSPFANKDQVKHLLEMMEIEKIAHLKPNQISGGQAQRVAIARALASKPRILLLDEPFSALDIKVKNKLLNEVNLLQKELGFTLILVSHNIAEIYRLSDRIIEIKKGKLISQKTPKQLFSKGNISLMADVLNIEIFSLIAYVDVLIYEEVLSFVCHPKELEGIECGDRVRVSFKSFSPMISKI